MKNYFHPKNHTCSNKQYDYELIKAMNDCNNIDKELETNKENDYRTELIANGFVIL